MIFKYLLVFLVSLAILISCMDDETTAPQSDYEDASLYFPGGLRSAFSYSIDTLNSYGEFIEAGNRITVYEIQEEYRSVLYTKAVNNYSYLSDSSSSRTLFRATDRAVYYAVDTLFISDLFENPALSEFSDDINFYPEINIFSSPIVENRYWTAFKLNFVFEEFIEYTLLEITATHKGKDFVSLEYYKDAVEAFRVEYRLSLVDPENIDSTLSYSASAWFVENLGMVKLEGNSIIIGVLTGFELQLSDAQKDQRQVLYDYEIIE